MTLDQSLEFSAKDGVRFFHLPDIVSPPYDI